MFVRLVLAAGTNAGTVAEILEGLYLVGRNEECQIRPESDSVSDRHCLLQHVGRNLRVIDLDSGMPTYVNHKPIEPKKWVVLNHGDMLRVGRLPFLVTITATDPSLPTSKAGKQPGSKKKRPANKSAPTKLSKEDFAEKETAELEPEEIQAELSDDLPPSDSPWRE